MTAIAVVMALFLAGLLAAAVIGVLLVVRIAVWLLLLPFRILAGLVLWPLALLKGIVAFVLVTVLAVVGVVLAAALAVGLAVAIVLPVLPLVVLGLAVWALMRLARRPATA